MPKQKAIEIIEERKRERRRERLRKIDAFEEKRPDYRLLKIKENELYTEKVLAEIGENTEAINKLDKAIAELKLKKDQILKEEGLTEDYFKEKPYCPVCLDTGYLKDGRMCNCLKEEIKKLSFNEYDLTEHIKEDTFKNFDLSIFSDSIDEDSGLKYSPRKQAQTNKEQAKIFCDTFKDSDTSLYIFGPVGTGKTYLVNCIVNELLENGVDLVYLSASNLVHLLSDDTIKYTATTNSNIERFKSVDLLIIDDLAAEYTNSFKSSLISEIIDERLVKARSTIITTNLFPDDLKKSQRYPVRMKSRILGCYDFLFFAGEDLREKLNSN